MRIRKNKFSICLAVALMMGLFACSNLGVTMSDTPIESSSIRKPIETTISTQKKINEKDDSWFDDFRIVKFGKYEQDGDISNGKEDIVWIILEDTGNDRLLISRDVLYAMPFDDKTELGPNETNGNWEKSSLRKWLNNDFFNEAFSDDEKVFVVDSFVKNGDAFGINNNDTPFDMGPDTSDKVYIYCQKMR